MDLAPPPQPGSRVQELGDRLIVSFRPRRSWAEIGFLTFWLFGWTLGGLGTIGELVASGDAGERVVLVLVVWLSGWAVGEVVVAGVIAWQLRGRALLVVSQATIEVRRGIGRFARTRRYDPALVRDVRAAPVPTHDEERPRSDYCLELAHDDERVRVGEGMGEREADYVALAVRARVRRSPGGATASIRGATRPRPRRGSRAANMPSGRRGASGPPSSSSACSPSSRTNANRVPRRPRWHGSPPPGRRRRASSRTRSISRPR